MALNREYQFKLLFRFRLYYIICIIDTAISLFDFLYVTVWKYRNGFGSQKKWKEVCEN